MAYTIINAGKAGNTVSVSINGKLYKKNCGNVEEANTLFKVALIAKEKPTDENIKTLKAHLNEKLRVAYLNGLECDPDSGDIFLAGFNTPIPQTLIDVIKDYHENNFPLQPIINFWKLLMINPDVRIRESLFKFITTHNFVLTDKGYMIVYKGVVYKEQKSNRNLTFDEYISNQFLHVKKDWKCSPNKYIVYKNYDVNAENEYEITKFETAKNWNEKEKNIEILGKLGDLYQALIEAENKSEDAAVYTDKHSRTMTIKLGEVVKMPRTECDGDPAVECSYGLHVGNVSYVNSFGRSCDVVLVCLINPMNVVAVPDYDHSKMRVTEYFPYALANYDKTTYNIDIVESPYFEEDYSNIEVKELEEMIKKVKAEEKPIEKAKNTNDESRSMSELLKIIESRLVDIKLD